MGCYTAMRDGTASRSSSMGGDMGEAEDLREALGVLDRAYKEMQERLVEERARGNFYRDQMENCKGEFVSVVFYWPSDREPVAGTPSELTTGDYRTEAMVEMFGTPGKA